MPPNTLKGRKDALVLVSAVRGNIQKEISKQLENLGLANLTIYEYFFAKRMNEVLRCVEILEDDGSAEVYTEVIESYLNGHYPSKKFISDNQYFVLPEFKVLSGEEVFIDCGAYVGDTIEKYIFSHEGVFKKIFAFEPDSVNYQAMEERVKRLNKEWALTPDKIQLVKAGIGSKTTSGEKLTRDANTRSAFYISEDTNSTDDGIKIYALDNFFADQRIDFLKADIEGSEWDMLHGAEKVIRRDLPKMAICIYHNLSDLYRILLWIDSLNLGYKFSIRHHLLDYFETVLYAYH